MQPIHDFFKSRDWPIVSFNLRGHGLSDKNPGHSYTFDDCVEDLHGVYTSLLKERCGYEQFNVLGHSMGTYISLKYALKYPATLNKMVLVATGAGTKSNRFKRSLMTIGIGIMRRFYDSFLSIELKRLASLELENSDKWADPELFIGRKANIDFHKELRDFNVKNALERISTPSLICVGEKDKDLKSSREVALGIKNGRLEVFPGSGHNLPVETGGVDALTGKMLEFLGE